MTGDSHGKRKRNKMQPDNQSNDRRDIFRHLEIDEDVRRHEHRYSLYDIDDNKQAVQAMFEKLKAGKDIN